MPFLAASSTYAFRTEERIVGTYYFYWYDWNSTLHFFVQDKDALTNHPPDIESYSYASVDWHRTQLIDMMEAGVDFLLPVYWGDRTNLFWALGGLDKLVEAEVQLREEGRDPPKIGMFFDTTALMVEFRHSGHSAEKPNLSTPYGKDLFYGMIYDFYSHIPPELWAGLDGAAIVWLYGSNWVLDYDQSLVDYTRERFAEDFNSTIFIVRERSWNLDTEMMYGWGAALGPVLLDVAAIGPGLDNDGAVRCYGQSPLERDRLDGHAYREDWERALRSGSNIVVIETWNELHEGTEIGETVELGRLYIEITGEYAALFKESSWDPGIEEVASLVLLEPDPFTGPPGEQLKVNLTIVNKGWLSWPRRLDLGFVWLALDSKNHSNEVVTVDFGDRFYSGQTHQETIQLGLPRYPGRYRVLVSTSHLGDRLEFQAVVAEKPLLWVGALLMATCLFIGKTSPPGGRAG
jgi:hypothetical protein